MNNIKNVWQKVLNSTGHSNFEICPDDALYNLLNITELLNLINNIISPFNENVNFKFFVRKACQGVYPVSFLVESTDIVDKCGIFEKVLSRCNFVSNFSYCDIRDDIVEASFSLDISYTINGDFLHKVSICKFAFMNGHWNIDN